MLKSDYLQRKTDVQRVRAMHIIRDVMFPFLLATFQGEKSAEEQAGRRNEDDSQMTDDDLVDSRLTLLNDIILELF